MHELERLCGVRLGKHDFVLSTVDDNQYEPIPTTEISKIDALKSERANQTSIIDQTSIVNQLSGKTQLKFEARSTQPRSTLRNNILALPKPEYQGKDFF
jgi:hypothetical protein